MNIEEIKAEAGDVEAQFNFAVKCLNGLGMTKNYKKAYKWFKKVSQAPIKMYLYYVQVSRFNLGEMYREGLGVQKDYKKALNWHTLSSILDYKPSVFCVELLKIRKEKALESYKEMMDSIEKDANNGDTEARFLLESFLTGNNRSIYVYY